MAVTKAITNSGFGSIIEATFPAQLFVFVDIYVPRNQLLVIALSVIF
jgi:hypothetical protein